MKILNPLSFPIVQLKQEWNVYIRIDVTNRDIDDREPKKLKLFIDTYLISV